MKFVVVLTAIIVCISIFVGYAAFDKRRFDQLCEQKNGKVLVAYTMRICVDSRILIDVEER